MGSTDHVLPLLTPATLTGILIAICGNVLISFALNLQKLAHKRLHPPDDDDDEDDHTPLLRPHEESRYLKSKLWYVRTVAITLIHSLLLPQVGRFSPHEHR
jgi:hypothetical protein